MKENQVEVQNEAYKVPWTILDTWLGVVLLILISVGLLVVTFLFQEEAKRLARGAGIMFAEMAYLLPVLIIFTWKRIRPGLLGFVKFDSLTMGLGCGLLIAAYAFVMAHNILLTFLGVDTQGEAVMKMLSELQSPVWLFLTAVIVARLWRKFSFVDFYFKDFDNATVGSRRSC
jgi:hypothetical protein